MNLSVVVPVYNAEKTLEPLAERIHKSLAPLGSRFELLFVNDGSRDDSWAVIQKLAGNHAWIRGISMMRNYGQHNALLAGIRAARFEGEGHPGGVPLSAAAPFGLRRTLGWQGGRLPGDRACERPPAAPSTVQRDE